MRSKATGRVDPGLRCVPLTQLQLQLLHEGPHVARWGEIMPLLLADDTLSLAAEAIVQPEQSWWH